MPCCLACVINTRIAALNMQVEIPHPADFPVLLRFVEVVDVYLATGRYHVLLPVLPPLLPLLLLLLLYAHTLRS